MMKSSKGEGSPTKPPSKPNLECCMCGDHGLSFELFRCKLCQFRSQHRYCSNLYPKAESYGLCNWCLTLDKGEETQNSSNSSSLCRNSSEDNDTKTKKKFGGNEKMGSCLKERSAPFKLQVKNRPINKRKSESPESSPPSPVALKSVATAGGRGGIEERLRRTKSDSGIVRHVFRNTVRRYKLLDEVSS